MPRVTNLSDNEAKTDVEDDDDDYDDERENLFLL